MPNADASTPLPVKGPRMGPSGTVFLSPADRGMDAQTRISAANASLQRFKLADGDTAQATVDRLVSKQQTAAHPLLSPSSQSAGRGESVERAMTYLTSNALFAGKLKSLPFMVVGGCYVGQYHV